MGWFDLLWRKPQMKTIAPAPVATPPPAPAKLPRMLILRGIAGHFAGRDWPRGALDEPSALEYASRRGYVGEVLDIDGAIGPQSRQVRMCLEAIRARGDVAALYGFSGGGYNVRYVLAALGADERKRIKLVVVLGAPNNPPALYRDGPWELVYRRDPPAGHMAGSKALLAELAPEATTAGAKTLAGKPLRYLIGADGAVVGQDGEITEVGYDAEQPCARGISIAYCNLWDEKKTGRYGPYLGATDTAEKYGELVIDPNGPGWEKNLRDQFERRNWQGFRYVELDNPDAYDVSDVVRAVDLAASYGFGVIAKNPLLIDGDPLAYVAHGAIAGVVVEQDAGSPQEMADLRRRAGKPELPIWFIAYGSGSGRAWANKTAQQAQSYRYMGVTFSSESEYGSSIDILRPR